MRAARSSVFLFVASVAVSACAVYDTSLLVDAPDSGGGPQADGGHPSSEGGAPSGGHDTAGSSGDGGGEPMTGGAGASAEGGNSGGSGGDPLEGGSTGDDAGGGGDDTTTGGAGGEIEKGGSGGETIAGSGGTVSKAGEGGAPAAGKAGSGGSITVAGATQGGAGQGGAPAGGAPQGGTGGTVQMGGTSGASGMTGAGGMTTTCNAKIVVNEISPDGASGSDEYVELYNAGDCDRDVSGWVVAYAAGSGTKPSDVKSFYSFASGFVFVQGSFFVLAGSGFTGSSDAVITQGFAAASGSVGIFTGTPSVAQRVDSMAYGTLTTPAAQPLVEGTSAGKPASGKADARVPDGTDTDDNSADFKVSVARTPGLPNE